MKHKKKRPPAPWSRRTAQPRPSYPDELIRADRLLNAARPELRRVLPAAIAGGADVAILVFDPTRSVLDKDCVPADEQVMWSDRVAAANAAGVPIVALLPVAKIARMFAHLPKSDAKVFADIIYAITVERDPAYVPIVYAVGWSFGLFELMATKGPPPLHWRFNLARSSRNAENTLEDLVALDLAFAHDINARDVIRRYQERARGLLVAETIRPAPRQPGDVLLAWFGGEELREAMLVRGLAGLLEQIDRALGAESGLS